MGAARSGMAFEWSALRQFRGSHVVCLVGLNPTMTRKGRERSTRSASANIGRWSARARTLVSKTSGILTDVWIETYRLPPIWVGPRSEVRVSKARK